MSGAKMWLLHLVLCMLGMQLGEQGRSLRSHIAMDHLNNALSTRKPGGFIPLTSP